MKHHKNLSEHSQPELREKRWASVSSLSSIRQTQEKITDSHFGYFWVFKEYPIKIPNLAEREKSQSGNFLGIPWLGIVSLFQIWDFYWVFFKYPKISKNGNPLFFPVKRAEKRTRETGYALPVVGANLLDVCLSVCLSF